MAERTTQIMTEAGAFPALLTDPPGGRARGGRTRGGVVVAQDIYGLNAGLRAQARGFALAGYAALTPDLTWRAAPGLELDPSRPADELRAGELLRTFSVERAILDLQRAIDHLRSEAGLAKIGIVGFGLGGLLAYLAAFRTSADAAVAYDGIAIERQLAAASAPNRPLMLHVGVSGRTQTADARAAIEAALGRKESVSLCIYAPRDHAFVGEVVQSGDPYAAELAEARTAAFLNQHLG